VLPFDWQRSRLLLPFWTRCAATRVLKNHRLQFFLTEGNEENEELGFGRIRSFFPSLSSV
jgi:hypothetical protein